MTSRPLFRSFLRGCWIGLITLVILAALVMSATRLLLPLADDYHDELAHWVGDLLDHPVRIKGLGVSWHGLGPSIELNGVTVLDAAGAQPLLQCDSARIDIDVLASLRHWQLELGQFTVRGAHVSVLRQEDGTLAVMGLDNFDDIRPDPAAQAAFKQWVARQRRLVMEDSTLRWRDLTRRGDVLTFRGVQVQMHNRGAGHRLELAAALPEQLGKQLTLRADVRGDLFRPAAWDGLLYVRGVGLRAEVWGDLYAWPQVAVRGGILDFSLWSEWQNGLQRVSGEVSAREPVIDIAPMTARLPTHPRNEVRPIEIEPAAVSEITAAPSGSLSLTRVHGQFQWRQLPGGWLLDVDQLSLQNGAAPAWPPSQVRVSYRNNASPARPQVEAAFSYVSLADALGLAWQAGAVPEVQRERLAQLAPRGELRDGYLRYQWGGDAPPTWLLRTGFRHLTLAAGESLPGVSGLSGRVVSDGAQGVVNLASGAGEFDAAQLFRAPLPLSAVEGQLVWRRAGESWQVVSHGLRLRNEDIGGAVAFRVVRTGGVTAPYIDLHAAFADGKGEHTSRYLPAHLLSARTVEWLDQAVVAGRVPRGTARLEGWLNEFPYDHGGGEFEVRFEVTGGELSYAQTWPRLTGITTEVVFRGRGVEANATAATSLGSTVTRAKVAIADLAARVPLLTVDGEASGPTADALNHVLQSPLRETAGHYLDGMSAQGQSRLKLAVRLPLAEHAPARVNGSLSFDDSSLNLRDSAVELTGIRGELGFTESGLRAREILAHLIGQPAVITVRSEAAAAHTALFEARGYADAALLAKKFLPALAPWLSGTAPWRGELRVAPPEHGGLRLQINTSLLGVEARLPEPFRKAAEDPRPLSLTLPLPLAGGRTIQADYDDRAHARLVLTRREDGELAIQRGELRFGGEAATLPDEMLLRARGALGRFAPAEWAALWPAASLEKNRKAGADDVVVELDLQVGNLEVMGQRFPDTGLRAVRRDRAWEMSLDGARAAGKITIPAGIDEPVLAEMQRVHFAGPSDQDVSASEAAAHLDPRTLPPLRLHATQFRYGGLDLGEVSLRTSRGERGMVVEKFTGRTGTQRSDITGRWEVLNDEQRSTFSVAFDSDDVGETLRALGYADLIKAGKMHTGLELSWPGSPADFAMARAQGALALKIDDGRLLEVSPGAGRILGLLSFQALPRRLSLDFSDLFQKGFAFDLIEGNFVIENGQAQTDNLFMDGPSAHILARGRVGLAAEDYDQRITVIPNMSGGLPLAAALAGGVVPGAAMLLVERLFKPQIDSVGRVDYRVTGPWSAPVVERVDEDTETRRKNK